MSFDPFAAAGMAPVSTAPATAGGRGFDPFEAAGMAPVSAPTAPATPPQQTGMLANIGAGTSDAVAGTLGAPVDIATGAMNLIPRGINAVAGTNIPTIQNPVGGSDWFRGMQGHIGADPRTVAPADEGEKVARAVGSGAASMVLPWVGARALPALGGMAGAVQDAFGAGSAGTQAAAGAVAGGVGQVAENGVSEPYKPLANFAGQLAGGGAVMGAGAAGKYAYGLGKQMVGNLAAPMTQAGRQDIAAARIQEAATDPAAAAAAIDQGSKPLTPGSMPTTFQATGDMGLGNLERAVQSRAPEQFLTRNNEQNAARVGTLQALAPEDAHPEAVSTAARSLFNHVDSVNAAREAAAQTAFDAAQRAEPASQGGLLNAARLRTSALGGDIPVGADAQQTALQGYGERMQSAAVASREASEAATARVWHAVDPDGTLAVGAGPLKRAAAEMQSRMTPESTPMDADTARIFAVARLLPDTLPFARLKTLRTQITNAIPELRQSGSVGASENTGRLSSLLSALHDTMDPAIQQRAAHEASAVAAGTMSVDQTMMARLHAETQDFLSRRAEADASARNGVGAGIGSFAGGSPAPLRGGPSTARQGGGGPGLSPGDQGVSGNPGGLTPNWDAAATDRYDAARAGTRQHYATYQDALGVGAMLKPGKFAGELATPASTVPSIMFAGNGQAERIQNALAAGVNRRDLLDYAAYDLRRSAAARDHEGTLDPTKAATWLARHREAATVLPEMNAMAGPAVQARQAFDAGTVSAAAARDAAEDAAKATLKDATAQRVTERRAFEQSAAGRFLGDAEPQKAVGRILGSDTAVADMQRLAKLTAGNPDARAGLQRAVVEHMLERVKSNAAAGNTGTNVLKSDVFQTWLSQRSGALKAIFSPQQIEGMRGVAADLQRANRSIAGTKLPGGSNTTQDLAAGAKHGHGSPSTLGLIVAAEVAGDALQHVGGFAGKAIGMIGAPVLMAMREGGMKKVDDLVTQAMLNPGLAKTLLLRPTKHAVPGVAAILSQQLRGLSFNSARTSGRNE